MKKRLDAFEMKGLRKILRVSWTVKKTNEWVLNKARVKRELLDTVKAMKLAYYGHTMRKRGSCLEKEIMQGTMPGARRRERPRMAWVDNINTWTGLSVEESIRMTEDRVKWRKYTSMVWPTLGSRTAKEQNRTAPAVWNSLPKTVLSSDSVAACKSRLKTFLFSHLFFLCLAPAPLKLRTYGAIQICLLLLFFIPQVVQIPGVKN